MAHNDAETWMEQDSLVALRGSAGPLHCPPGQPCQGTASIRVRRGHQRQGFQGLVGHLLSEGIGSLDTVSLINELQSSLQVTAVFETPLDYPGELLAARSRGHPEVLIAMEAEDHRRREVSFPQVLPCWLPEFLPRANEIQHIIGDLKSQAKVEAVAVQDIADLSRWASEHRARPACSGQQRCGFVKALLQVVEKTDLGVEALRTLRHLSIAKLFYHQGDQSGYLILLQGLDEARGVGKEEIPTEHRNVWAEDPMHRLLLPPRVGVIEDVVVDQGSRVDDLNRRREHQDLVVGNTLRRSCSHRIPGHRPALGARGVVQHGVDQQAKRWTETLASTAEDLFDGILQLLALRRLAEAQEPPLHLLLALGDAGQQGLQVQLVRQRSSPLQAAHQQPLDLLRVKLQAQSFRRRPKGCPQLGPTCDLLDGVQPVT
mmetsp:Transcript_85654/g.205289  ORF Transcript_85654/g.205289 Transcript_85654/m.205289 type:complete len:430 (-) Transcript_85654:361-1650(-)